MKRDDLKTPHGLIPLLVAMRVKAERQRRAEKAAGKDGEPVEAKPKKKKRGWFG